MPGGDVLAAKQELLNTVIKLRGKRAIPINILCFQVSIYNERLLKQVMFALPNVGAILTQAIFPTYSQA